jgi:hypothetical protein
MAGIKRYTYPYQLKLRKDDFEFAQRYCKENEILLSETLREIVVSFANKQRIKENNNGK